MLWGVRETFPFLISDAVTSGECAGNYLISRTVEITNCAGGSAEYTYAIQIEDTAAPEFTSVPADYTVECSDNMPMEEAAAADTVEKSPSKWP